MAEEPEPDEPSNAPDEEGSDRSPDGDSERDESHTAEAPTDNDGADTEDAGESEETATSDESPESETADDHSDPEEPDDEELDNDHSDSEEPDDEADETDSGGPEPIVDFLGESGPRPHEWLGDDGETDVVTDPDAEAEPESDAEIESDAESEETGGLTRVDDEDETPASADGRRPEEEPPERTRSGHPGAPPGSPEHDAMAPGSAPDPDPETDVIGPLPPEEAEEREPDSYDYVPETVPDVEDPWEDAKIEEDWEDSQFDEPDEDFIDQYETQEELIKDSGDQQLLEPDTEPAVEEPSTGGVLEREREGPPDDQEMPLTAHIEEMVKRLGVVVVIAAVVTILAWPFSEGATLHIWQAVLPTADAPDPHLYGPLEKILTQIKVAGLAGVLIALPMVVYQTYRFMRPGLYPHERRYYLAAVPTSLVLAAAGMAFSYFLVLPTLFVYFMYYTEGSVDLVAFGLAKTFTLIVTLTGVLAVVFQIPLFIMLAIMMGVTSRRWLASKRIYFWAGFAGVSFLIAPDPTGMAPFLVAGTAIGLFEGTLFLLKWVKRGRRRYRRSREDGA